MLPTSKENEGVGNTAGRGRLKLRMRRLAVLDSPLYNLKDKLSVEVITPFTPVEDSINSIDSYGGGNVMVL